MDVDVAVVVRGRLPAAAIRFAGVEHVDAELRVSARVSAVAFRADDLDLELARRFRVDDQGVTGGREGVPVAAGRGNEANVAREDRDFGGGAG